MKNKENLKNLDTFIEATVNKDDTNAINESISNFIKNKISNIVLEFNSGKVTTDGDEVSVDGVHVGDIIADINNPDSEITFVSIDGNFRKEFPGEDGITRAYEWIAHPDFIASFKKNFADLKARQNESVERLQKRIDMQVNAKKEIDDNSEK